MGNGASDEVVAFDFALAAAGISILFEVGIVRILQSPQDIRDVRFHHGLDVRTRAPSVSWCKVETSPFLRPFQTGCAGLRQWPGWENAKLQRLCRDFFLLGSGSGAAGFATTFPALPRLSRTAVLLGRRVC